MAEIDAAKMVGLSRKVRKRAEDPNQWYLVMGAPTRKGAVVYAYASNAYGEGAYISAKPDGKVVSRMTW